ncbi:MAG: two-component system response regulator BaeR [Gammaproteobacteria bacterium]|jgi:two-component system response regulator BaeR
MQYPTTKGLILIVEDEIKIAELLGDYCKDAGFETKLIHNGDEALIWLNENTAQLMLLDLMLPGSDGLTICKEIRKHSELPIIMLTARVEEIDRLLGLELGADDYICKPFSPREVIARIKSVLRRIEKPALLKSALALDESSLRVRVNDSAIELTLVEFKLLQALHEYPGRIFSRDSLMSKIYNDNRIVTDRTIDSHIKKLRKKLADINLIDAGVHSVYGAGYKFE